MPRFDSYTPATTLTGTDTTLVWQGGTVKRASVHQFGTALGNANAIVYAPISSIRTIEQRLLDYVSVLDFGAKGDGSTDDTVSVQAGLDYVRDNGGSLSFPKGTYLISETLTVSSNSCLIGERGQSILQMDNSFADGTSLLQTSTVTGTLDTFEYENITFDGLTFDGNNRTQTTYRGMVRIGKTNGITFVNCQFKNHKYIMLSLLGCKNFKIQGNEFTAWGKDDVAAEGGAALYISNADDETTSKYGSVAENYFHDGEWSTIYGFAQKCDFTYNTMINFKEGVYFRWYDTDPQVSSEKSCFIGNRISGVDVKNIQGAGMEIGGRNVVIAYNDVEDCEGSGIILTDVCDDVSVLYNKVRDTVKDTTTFAEFGQIMVRSTMVSDIDPKHIQIIGNRIGDTYHTPVAPYGIAVITLNAATDPIDPLIIRNNDVTDAAADSANNIYIEEDAVGNNLVVEGNVGHASFVPYVGYKVLSAETGDVVIDGVGFKPRLVTIEAIQVSATIVSRSFGARARNAIGSYGTFAHVSTASRGGLSGAGNIVNLVDVDGNLVFDANLSSFDVDGFTLSVATASVAPRIVYICYP